MAWVCVNSFGTELIFETEPHRSAYSWRDDYGSCKCIEIPQGTIRKLIGRVMSKQTFDFSEALRRMKEGKVIWKQDNY